MAKGSHHFRAAAAEAKARGKQGLRAAMERAKAAQPGAVSESERIARVSHEASDSVLVSGRAGLAKLGEHSVGVAAGKAVRRFGVLMGQIPILSLPRDALVAKNGIEPLTQYAREHSRDPMAIVWLVEAHTALARDQLAFDVARTVLMPQTVITREALRAAGKLGVGSPIDVLTAHGRAIATARLNKDKKDAVALHAIARLALQGGRPADAAKAARLAATASTGWERGAAFATLAHAYLELGQGDMAALCAQAAVKFGCTIGWNTLADLTYHNSDSSPEEDAPAADAGDPRSRSRYRQYVDLASRVDADDVRRYHGFAPDIKEIRAAITKAQSQKIQGLSALPGKGMDSFLQYRARRATGKAAQIAALPSTTPHRTALQQQTTSFSTGLPHTE